MWDGVDAIRYMSSLVQSGTVFSTWHFQYKRSILVQIHFGTSFSVPYISINVGRFKWFMLKLFVRCIGADVFWIMRNSNTPALKNNYTVSKKRHPLPKIIEIGWRSTKLLKNKKVPFLRQFILYNTVRSIRYFCAISMVLFIQRDILTQ